MTELAFMDESAVKAVAEIEKACFSEPWSEEGIRAELADKTAVFFVAKHDGKIAGYAGMHNVVGECYIANIAVLPEFRRRGIADALISALIKNARENGGEFISLEVRESNSAAIALYEKTGFEKCGIRKNFYSKPCENAAIMTKVL